MKILAGVMPLLLFGCILAGCNKPSGEGCYKGKLVRKGICMNYTISVVSGNMDTALVESGWTDPQTNTSFANAFRLGSVCSFPSEINEGDEFWFTIDNSQVQNCAVCMAYYPTPQRALNIRVLNGPCQ